MRSADGTELVVTGQKSFVTGGDTADFVAAMCGLREADGTKAGTALVVIDLQLPGVVVQEVFGSLDGGTHAYLRFEGVRVPVPPPATAITVLAIADAAKCQHMALANRHRHHTVVLVSLLRHGLYALPLPPSPP